MSHADDKPACTKLEWGTSTLRMCRQWHARCDACATPTARAFDTRTQVVSRRRHDGIVPLPRMRPWPQLLTIRKSRQLSGIISAHHQPKFDNAIAGKRGARVKPLPDWSQRYHLHAVSVGSFVHRQICDKCKARLHAQLVAQSNTRCMHYMEDERDDIMPRRCWECAHRDTTLIVIRYCSCFTGIYLPPAPHWDL